MMGTVVFDFDDTLADTVAFKRALADGLDAVDRMADFVFPSAMALLSRLKADGWTLALLTLGDPAWQARKLERSGLLPSFDHVLCTAEPKVERLADILAWPHPLVFVNDNGAELDALQAALPGHRMIAVRGPKALPTAPVAAVCESLAEVYSRIAAG